MFCEHCGTGPDCVVCGRSDPACERCDGTGTEFVITPVCGRECLCEPCADMVRAALERRARTIAERVAS